MAHKNKKTVKPQPRAKIRRRSLQRWLFCILLLTIVVVSYAVVRATTDPRTSVTAPEGSTMRASQLQSAEQTGVRNLNQTYDARYHETVLLDADAMQQVITGSHDDSL